MNVYFLTYVKHMWIVFLCYVQERMLNMCFNFSSVCHAPKKNSYTAFIITAEVEQVLASFSIAASSAKHRSEFS